MFETQEAALSASVWNTGDRIGASPPRRLCSVFHTHAVVTASSVGTDAATLSLKQISVTHDDMLLSNSLNAISALQKYGTSGKQFKPDQLAKNWGID